MYLDELRAVAATAEGALDVLQSSSAPWRASMEVRQRFAQFWAGYLDLLAAISEYDPRSAVTGSGSRGMEPGTAFWTTSGRGLVNQFWEDYVQVSPFLTNLPDPDEGLGSYIEYDEAKRNFHELEQALLERVEGLENSEKRLETIEQTAREAVGSIATGTYAKRYTDEANKQRLLSIAWGSVLVGFSTILAFLIFKSGPQPEEVETAVELGGRALRLALPSAGLVFAIRQFSAARHNMLVFKNKALALGTFEAFVEASPDDGTRSAVVLEVSKSVFSQQPTGFLRGGTGTPETTSTNIITEAFKANGS